MNRVVLEDRHKFVYYDDKSIESLRSLYRDYNVDVNSDRPIVIYEIIEPLPKVDTKLILDQNLIKIFHERYYELIIFLAMINCLYQKIDIAILNDKLKKVLKLCSYFSDKEINDVKTLINLLVESKNIYKVAYQEYIETGRCDFYDKVPIPYIMIDNLIPYLKTAIGLKKHFSLMLEFNDYVSLMNSMAINGYIASRCNGYLSVNILLKCDSHWNCYYANNGQFIQEVHDYTELDFSQSKNKMRSRQK